MLAVTIVALFTFPSFAAQETNPAPGKAYEQAARENEASFVTEIVFDKGSSELSADGKSQLRDLLSAAQGKGKIEEIKVLAWADKEYPTRAQMRKLGRDERKLADERAQEIKGYFEDSTRNIDLDLHNMAERPHELEELFKTKDARVKRSLERAGLATPMKSGMPSKTSRALVFVIVQ